MKRCFALCAVATLSVALMQPSLSVAAPKVSDTAGITVVISLDVKKGRDRAAVVKALKAVAAAVRKQPGLLEETLMENNNPEMKPAYVDVTRWRSLQDWIALSSNPEFQKVLAVNSPFVVMGSGFFTPVK